MRNQRTTMMKPLLLTLLTIAACWLGVVSSAWGQMTRENVRAKLEQTDRLIERARDVAIRVGGPRAGQMLKAGEQLQRQAWEAFQGGRLHQAERMTEMARQRLGDMISAFRQNEDNATEVERQLEHTDRTLQDVRDQLGPDASPPRARRLAAATDMQRRAWDLFRQQRLRPALKLTLQAREMAVNVTAGGPGSGFGHGPMRGDQTGLAFSLRFERLQEAAARVGERVEAADNDAARDMWQRAQRAIEDARIAHDAGDDRRADQMLRLGRESLERAMRQIQPATAGGDQVEVLISSANERLDLLAAPVQDSGENRLKDWLDQARQDLESAQGSLADGRLKEALVQTRRAVALLDKIADELGL